MKAAYYVNSDDKKDVELLLRQALTLYREHNPAKKTLESKVREIVKDIQGGGKV